MHIPLPLPLYALWQREHDNFRRDIYRVLYLCKYKRITATSTQKTSALLRHHINNDNIYLRSSSIRTYYRRLLYPSNVAILSLTRDRVTIRRRN